MYVRASFSSLHETQQDKSQSDLNRRQWPREKTDELAELIIDLNGRKVACLVKNISKGGAMIETSMTTLPKHLILDYPAKNIHRACRAKWMLGNKLGLEFI